MPVALITGTSTGIGLQTALLFARKGYRVWAGARTPSSSKIRNSLCNLQLAPITARRSYPRAMNCSAQKLCGRVLMWSVPGCHR